jgi:hypothetical protein
MLLGCNTSCSAYSKNTFISNRFVDSSEFLYWLQHNVASVLQVLSLCTSGSRLQVPLLILNAVVIGHIINLDTFH